MTDMEIAVWLRREARNHTSAMFPGGAIGYYDIADEVRGTTWFGHSPSQLLVNESVMRAARDSSTIRTARGRRA